MKEVYYNVSLTGAATQKAAIAEYNRRVPHFERGEQQDDMGNTRVGICWQGRHGREYYLKFSEFPQ